nr:hypothetical protein [Streptomyces sp. TS71-3]
MRDSITDGGTLPGSGVPMPTGFLAALVRLKRRVRGAGDARGVGHLRHPAGPAEAAEVADVRLDHVDEALRDHAADDLQRELLLGRRDRQVELLGHVAHVVQLPAGVGLLQVVEAVLLKAAAHRDRAAGRVRAVGVGVEQERIAEGLPHGRYELCRGAVPQLGVAAVAHPDLDLRGGEAVALHGVADPPQLLTNGCLAAHAGRVHRHPAAEGPAEQPGHGLAGEPAPEAPQGGVDAADHAHQETAG